MYFRRHELFKALFCKMINYLTGSLEWFACAATLSFTELRGSCFIHCTTVRNNYNNKMNPLRIFTTTITILIHRTVSPSCVLLVNPT